MSSKILGRAVLVPKGNWSRDINYTYLDFVLYDSDHGGDGCCYAAKKDNHGVRPGTDSSVWMKITERGESGQGAGDVLLGPIVEENVPVIIPE